MFATGNPILHGEAVAMGMIAEAHLAYLENLISEEDSKIIIENIQRYYPYLDISDFKDEDITALLLNDKKNTDSKINFLCFPELDHVIMITNAARKISLNPSIFTEN
jgi:3-dehydroquinate synthetase